MEGLTLFRSILTVLVVLLLAYYCSRLLGKRGMRISRQSNLKVIEQLPVGQGRILLLKVGGRAYLVGVSHAGIQLLKELEEDVRLDETVLSAEDGLGEKSALQKNLEKYAGDALDWTGEFLKKKAGRFKEGSRQGAVPYESVPAKGQSFQEALPGDVPAKGQSFQEILQKSAAISPAQEASEKAPEDTGPRPIEGGEKDG